jgi:hypothetical protein
LCAVARPEGWKHRATSTAGMRQLRIYGERFQPEQIPPKKVPLALVAHKCEKAARLAGDYCNQSLLSVNGLDSSGHRRTLLVDGQVLVDSPPFDDWLIKQLRSRVPASIQGIVFQDDPSSKQMAEKCAAYLKELAIDLPWGLHSSVDLDGGLTTLIAERALLIVAAVVSKGSQLLGISRDLRTSHFGSKSYLIGVQMCDTESEASFLKRNLSQTKDGTNNFECFHVLATGGALKESLREEESAIRGSDARAGALAYRWDARRQKGLVEDTFLPALVTQNHRLKLRPDFVFWSCDYVESARHAPTVLATIGAILQRARTEDFRLDEHRLASDAFQQVVLDPQNFNRYNDGIIQASILRQAYSSELDYSTLPDESRFMLVLIKKLLVARNKQQGEAVAEFAFAIGSGRLKLQEDDHVALITWANAFLSDQSGDFELKCLLDPTYGGAAHGAVI